MSRTRESIEGAADRVVAADVVDGRPGKVPLTPTPGRTDRPPLGCFIWIALVVIALVVGLIVGLDDGDREELVQPEPTPSTTSGSAVTTPTTGATTTSVPAGARVVSITGGWDHPPYATPYVNGATGQPVAGQSVVLACVRVSGATTGSLVVVRWGGPSGPVEGVGRIDASGGVVVPGGIDQPGAYAVQAVRIAPPGNVAAASEVAVPAGAPTTVTLPDDRICSA